LNVISIGGNHFIFCQIHCVQCSTRTASWPCTNEENL
jgi:hypothetical protein